MSVRVIRCESAPTGAEPASAFVPTARRLDANLYAATVQAERVLAEANRRAAEIERQARASADEVREQARAKGERDAHSEAAALLMRIRRSEASLVDDATDLILAGVRAVCERALSEAIAADDATLEKWIAEAMAPIQGARRIVVRGSLATCERLRRVASQPPQPEVAIEWVVDGTFDDLQVVAESNVGGIRLDLRTQVDSLVLALENDLARAVQYFAGHSHG